MNNLVVCLPHPGKPNPSLVYDSTLKVPRERVVQAGMKGNASWYYAFNMIRQRIGKNPSESQRLSRITEKLVSKVRKQQECNYKEMRFLLHIEKELRESFGVDQISKEVATRIISELESGVNRKRSEAITRLVLSQRENMQTNSVLVFVANDPLNQFQEIIQPLKAFLRTENCDHFLDFIENKSVNTDIDICKKFVKEISENIYQHTEFALSGKSLTDQALLSDRLLFLNVYVLYELKKVSWPLEIKIEAICDSLQKHGPHVVKGHFGRAFYKDAPFQLSESIEGRPVYGWKPGAERQNTNALLQHSVVIVAAGKNRLYYLDPLDGSDTAPSSQKVYAMSIEAFKRHVDFLPANPSMAHLRPELITATIQGVYNENYPKIYS